MPEPMVRRLALCALATGAAMLAAATMAHATADLSALVEASKAEPGLKIHANVGGRNWPGIVQAFTGKYPWIKVEPLDIGPNAAFDRYHTETAAGLHSADVMVVASPSGWLRFIDQGGIEPYEAVEGADAPAWSRPFKGVYTFSTDPLLLIYNKKLVPENERPRSLAGLAHLAKTDPKRFAGRITTYDARLHPFAEGVHLTYTMRRGEAGWKLLETLGPVTRPENAGDSIFEKVAGGTYAAGYFMTGVLTFLQIDQDRLGDVVGWNLLDDGTPVIARGMGVTRNAVSKASARLFVEFALSHEGQVAIGKSGLTPYRADVRKDEVPYLTYQSIVDQIGEKNTLLVLYDRGLLDQRASFLARWNKAFQS